MAKERLEITKVSPRGDWTDPFSGLVVHFDNDVCPANGARRDGDQAELDRDADPGARARAGALRPSASLDEVLAHERLASGAAAG